MKLFRAIWVIIVSGLLFSPLKTPLASPAPAGHGPVSAIIFVAAPTVVPGELTERFPQGSHLVRLSPGAPSRDAVNLTPGFFTAADPQISSDAAKVLFSAQKTRSSRWQIWEMNVDGSAKRQLARCPADCLRPAYLPRKQIVFTMVSGKGFQRTSAIYVAQQSGADAHPITFGPGNFQVESVLRSGRILVSARSSLVAGGRYGDSRVFYTLRPDGSGLRLFRWNNQPNIDRTGATELDDGTVVFVKRPDPAGRITGGALAWFRPGVLDNSVITPANSVYWSAHVLDGNRLIVSKADSPAGKRKFALYVFNLSTRTTGKAVYSSPKFSSVQAVPVEPRQAPLYYPSSLNPKRDYGRVVCLNSYLCADAPRGLLPVHIAHVRVIALQPDHHREQVLGEAPVESDGSFYIKVPANRPIRFELLSSKGAVIHAQKSWIWARRGEDVACLGCHENKALVPGDHWPLALKRPDAPIPVGVSSIRLSAEH